jgi:hypothetical protein
MNFFAAAGMLLINNIVSPFFQAAARSQSCSAPQRKEGRFCYDNSNAH